MKFHDEDGKPVQNPTDLDFETRAKCDICDREGDGLVKHSAGGSGLVSAVLFECYDCIHGQAVFKVSASDSGLIGGLRDEMGNRTQGPAR